MPDLSELVRVPDQEALEMLRTLAAEDIRNMGPEVAWLIRQEYARRYSQPNPAITVEEAEQAVKNQK